MIRFYLVLISIFSGTCLLEVYVKAQEPRVQDQVREDPTEVLSCEATIQYQEQRNHYYANVDLKSLPAGKRYRLRLQVTNPTNQEIEFSAFDFQCRCMKLESKIASIPPQGSQEFVFFLNVPQRSQQADVLHQVRFIKDW